MTPADKLARLAREFRTPLYVYNFDIVQKRNKDLMDAFAANQGGLRVHYAVKANSNFKLLQMIAKESRIGADCVSPGEVILALRAGFPASDILFTANNITDEEMAQVWRLGVLFNIGSLSRLAKFGRDFPGADVCVRFNPGVVAGENPKVQTGGGKTKFGVSLGDLSNVLEIVKAHKLRVVGIHEHTGSGIGSASAILESASKLLTIATRSNFPDLKFIDLGGGFKIPYRPEEKRISIQDIGRKVCGLLNKHYASEAKKHKCRRGPEQDLKRETTELPLKPLELRIEPGKWMVGECGSLLVEVNTVKSNGTRRIVGTNSGFNHLIRPTLYGAYHHIRNLTAETEGRTPSETPRHHDMHMQPGEQGRSRVGEGAYKYDICGNICETGDVFASNRPMATAIREGDILSIETAGAYGFTMGSLYNMRPLPGEVIIRSGRPPVVGRTSRSSSTLVEDFIRMSTERRDVQCKPVRFRSRI